MVFPVHQDELAFLIRTNSSPGDFFKLMPYAMTAGEGSNDLLSDEKVKSFLEIISPEENKMLYSWRNNFRSHEIPNHRKRERERQTDGAQIEVLIDRAGRVMNESQDSALVIHIWTL